MTKFGKWNVWTMSARPDGLRDDQRVEVTYIGSDGLMARSEGRAIAIQWFRGQNLAYRKEIEPETHVLYGEIGGTFGRNKHGQDTHKLTYTVNGDDIICFKMEKL